MAISPGNRLTTFLSDIKRISHSSLKKEIDVLGKEYREWLSKNIVGINKYNNTLDSSLRKDAEIKELKKEISLLRFQLNVGRKDDENNNRSEHGNRTVEGQVGSTERETSKGN